MLDFAPNKDGLINPDQAARYAEVGAWIRGCYDHPLAEARFDGTLDSALEHATVLVGTDAGPFDRVVIRENQTTGQRVRGCALVLSFNFLQLSRHYLHSFAVLWPLRSLFRICSFRY